MKDRDREREMEKVQMLNREKLRAVVKERERESACVSIVKGKRQPNSLVCGNSKEIY